MVYNVTPDVKFGWHITLLKKAAWQVEKVTFTSKALIEALRDSGLNPQGGAGGRRSFG